MYHDNPSHIFRSEQKSIRLGDVSVIETNDVLQMKVANSTQEFVKKFVIILWCCTYISVILDHFIHTVLCLLNVTTIKVFFAYDIWWNKLTYLLKTYYIFIETSPFIFPSYILFMSYSEIQSKTLFNIYNFHCNTQVQWFMRVNINEENTPLYSSLEDLTE